MNFMKMLLQMSRFVCVGFPATTVHSVTLVFLVKTLRVKPLIGSVPAFTFALLSSYLLNHHWTFTSTGNHLHYFPRYVFISIAGLLFNLPIMYGVVDLLGKPWELGLFFVVLSLPILTFFLHRFWTFYDESTPG
jgi:putative flippase GtrA